MSRIISKVSVKSTGKWSAWLALACAVHCILMPFVSAALPLIGMQFLESTFFEAALVGVGLSFGAYSIWKGYRQIHDMKSLPAAFVAGAGLMLSGIVFFEEPLELVFVISGAVMVAIAQLVNLRLTHAATCEDHAH